MDEEGGEKEPGVRGCNIIVFLLLLFLPNRYLKVWFLKRLQQKSKQNKWKKKERKGGGEGEGARDREKPKYVSHLHEMCWNVVQEAQQQEGHWPEKTTAHVEI